MIHNLKTVQPFFERVRTGVKTFEVRKNDRDYQTGDHVTLHEYDPIRDLYGQQFRCRITYVLTGGQFGIEPGYCVFGIEEIKFCGDNED